MTRPPAALRWVAGRLLPASHRDDILDDLDEDFTRRTRRPALWYLAQSIHLAVTRPWHTRVRMAHSESRHIMWSTIWQDVRYGMRTLRRAPGFSTIAILSLALGIGLNSTIFAMVDNLLLRPLPYANPDSLVAIYTSDERDSAFGSSSYLDYRDMAEQNTTLSAIVGHAMMFAAVSIDADNRLTFGEIVTANYFSTLGIPLAFGQGFSQDDDRVAGGHPVTIISHRLWQRSFGGRADVIGRTLKIKSRPYTIVGVTTADFVGSMPGLTSDLWIPVSQVDDVEPAGQISVVPSASGTTTLELRGFRWMFLKGRLRDGVSREAAQANLAAIMAAAEAAYPVSNRERRPTVVPVTEVRFHPEIDAIMRPASAVLAGAVGLVLLIACANLASMLLARGAARTREMALRSAIGATRTRLMRQIAVESVVLSLTGGIVGLGIAVWASSAIVSAPLPIDIPISFSLPIDWRLAAFSLVLSLVTGLAFGVLPALRASRPDLVPSLKDDATLSRPGRAFGLRHALVVVQVAVAVVLLVGGLLLTRSVFAGFRSDPGLTLDGLVTATISMDLHGYEDGRARAFFDSATERIRQLPGVTHVALAERMPFSPNTHTTTIVVDGRPEATPRNGAQVDTTRVTPEFFDTLGVRVIEGRGFDSRDTTASTAVAVVSQAFAKQYFPNGDAVGSRVRQRDQSGKPYEIVGITSDYAVRSIGEQPRPLIQFAAEQSRSSSYSFAIRTAGDSSALAAALQRELRAMEPDLVFLEVGPVARMAAASIIPITLGAWIFGGLAALAMLLAGLGLYGVIAFSVSRRTREIGIRMALGSTRGAVVSAVVREAVLLVGLGLLVGVGLAMLAAQSLGSVLLGVTALDPVSYLAAFAGLLIVTAIAAVVPARRAASVDPLIALRTN